MLTTNADYELVLLWNRSLSDVEVAAISANPWQVFQPRVGWLFPSAGFATYTNIGAIGIDAGGVATYRELAIPRIASGIRSGLATSRLSIARPSAASGVKSGAAAGRATVARPILASGIDAGVASGARTVYRILAAAAGIDAGVATTYFAGIPLLLPHELTAEPIIAGNTDPFGIDPDRTTRLSTDTDPFGIDPDRTTRLSTDTDPFGIDPDRTTPL